MMAEVRALEDRLAKDPKDPEALRRLGDLNFDISNWQKAEDLYSRYLEVRPDDPDVMTDLGVTLRGLKQFDRALEVFQRVEKVAPDHWQSRYNQVVVLAFDLNRFDAAQPVLDELKRLQPNNDKVTELADAVQRRRPA
jgi:tetratricopeptide (TPR) repeat protein